MGPLQQMLQWGRGYQMPQQMQQVPPPYPQSIQPMHYMPQAQPAMPPAIPPAGRYDASAITMMPQTGAGSFAPPPPLLNTQKGMGRGRGLSGLLTKPIPQVPALAGSGFGLVPGAR